MGALRTSLEGGNGKIAKNGKTSELASGASEDAVVPRKYLRAHLLRMGRIAVYYASSDPVFGAILCFSRTSRVVGIQLHGVDVSGFALFYDLIQRQHVFMLDDWREGEVDFDQFDISQVSDGE